MKKVWKIVDVFASATGLCAIVGAMAVAFAMSLEWAKDEIKTLTE